MSELNMSRRRVIGGAIGTLVAGAAAGAQASAIRPEAWDETYDVVIVGSGFAGLSAAYEAVKHNVKRILILEKMEAWGGNSALCGALMCMPLTKMQKAKGIKDSPEMLVKDMMAAGRGFNHPELALTMAKNAAKAFDMLEECGVEFQDKVIRLGGHSAPRAHLPKVPSGGSITVPMHKWLRSKNVEFRNRANVHELVMNEGAVEGVRVTLDYDWHTGEGRREVAIRALKGVVVASGGWGQDNEFVSVTQPSYARLECTSQPGSTATMIKAMLAAGALPVMLDMFQLGPWASPDEKGAGPGSFFADYAFGEGMAIDPTTGRRFMNELADRRTRAEAQMKVLEKGTKEKPNYPFCFCSEETTKHAEGFKGAYREGTVKKSDSVEALAKLHGVADVEELKKSIAEWNEIVAGKKEDPFKKPLDVRTELKPPFYSMRLSPKLHYCMGGACITTKAEVLSSQTCKPIPGLYAAGEVTGGVHGMDRLGGCSSVDCFVFGRIAGAEVAARKA